ncbi:MAG: hypothetical protein AB7P08_18820 [Burkholderiales bacterium]
MKAALAALAALAAANAQALTLADLEHFTENRGWNDAGLGPTHQVIVTARVVPSGMPTLVHAEANGAREPMTHFPQPGAEHIYVLWKRFEPGAAETWSVTARRGDRTAPALRAPALRRPQQVPLAADVRIDGDGTEPTVSWKLPELKGFDVERIRVGVRGGKRVHGRFLSLLRVSEPLAPAATSFRVPPGWLQRGERYVFQVMLEDLEDDRLENRSLAFSERYRPAR